MTLAYYAKNVRPDVENRNSWAITVAIDIAQWPERTRSHKGLKFSDRITSRQATPTERNVFQKAYRLTFFRYKSIEALMEDEIDNLGAGHPFLNELEEKLKPFKLIPKKKIT